MMNPYSVLKKIMFSEKTQILREEQNKYCFYVDRNATKDDVKQAIEGIYKVNVLKVNTLVLRGKVKKKGVNISKGVNRKKAVVTLAGKQKLPMFEGL